MPKKPALKLPYDVPWILQRFRAFLLGREHRTALRWAKDLAPKTQPQPELPLGSSSKIRFNYYCDRDPRGEVMRPSVLYEAEVKQKRVSGYIGTGPAGYMLEKGQTCREEGKHEVIKEEDGDGKVAGERAIFETAVKTGAERDEGKKKIKEEKGNINDGEKEGVTKKRVRDRYANETVGNTREVRDGSKATGIDKENIQEVDTDFENLGEMDEKEIYNAVKRVPGKVWHWDAKEGDPTKQCCGK